MKIFSRTDLRSGIITNTLLIYTAIDDALRGSPNNEMDYNDLLEYIIKSTRGHLTQRIVKQELDKLYNQGEHI